MNAERALEIARALRNCCGPLTPAAQSEAALLVLEGEIRKLRAALAACEKELTEARAIAKRYCDSEETKLSALKQLHQMGEKLAAAEAREEKLREAVREIDALERKCSDAWNGGIGDASLIDLGNIGKIARRILKSPPPAIPEPQPSGRDKTPDTSQQVKGSLSRPEIGEAGSEEKP